MITLFFSAFIQRGENGGPTDNRAGIAEMVRLRAERAALLGYKTFADYRLDDQMAKTPAAARKLLEEVWTRARAKALARLRAKPATDPAKQAELAAKARERDQCAGIEREGARLRPAGIPADAEFERTLHDDEPEDEGQDRGADLGPETGDHEEISSALAAGSPLRLGGRLVTPDGALGSDLRSAQG